MQQAILLCDDLKEVYDFEVQHGNTLDYIAEPAGSNCPYAVVFKKPLKILGNAGSRRSACPAASVGMPRFSLFPRGGFLLHGSQAFGCRTAGNELSGRFR